MKVRTRFAPSPTGYLHIGGARTALFSYLYARKHGGSFILRVEDTDRERSTQAAIDAILAGMEWLTLDYDEGPVYQTHRYERYREMAYKMLEQGSAYRCYCSKERLEQLREQQMQQNQKPKYDGFCRDKELNLANQSYVLRFKNPLEGEVIVQDEVHGSVVFNNTELDDFIIFRSDGHPTYNFAVVIDDLDMQITHVIRGDDHLNNTPKQMNLLAALNAAVPTYAHVPMILGPDGKKLSKRSGAASVMEYRDEGYLPEAVLNYLARLGWSHGDQEIFSREELIRFFDTQHLNHSAAALNPEKLLWLNQHYLKSLAPAQVKNHLDWHLKQQNLIGQLNAQQIEYIIKVQADRSKTLVELVEKSHFLFVETIEYPSALIEKHMSDETKPALLAFYQALQQLTEWQKESLHVALHDVVEQFQLKLGKIGPVIRIAVTGDTQSPSIDATLALLGREKTLARMKAFLEYIQVK